MLTISAGTARRTLTAQLDRVEAGEEIAVTRHGKVVAVLVRPDVLLAHRAHHALDHAEHVRERLARARTEPVSRAAFGAERVEELTRDLRDGRSGR